MKTSASVIWALAGWLASQCGISAAGDAVQLHVGDDLQQVRVEAMDAETGRWIAIASGYRDHSDSGWLKIALPEGYGEAQLRVLGSSQPSPFAGHIESARSAEATTTESLLAPGYVYGSLDSAEGGRDAKEEPVIEEADIWAWNGPILYFYNQYRGLQVIDMADPLAPEWLDYFRYPARGEDLYALEDGTIILIGSGGYWSSDDVVALKLLQFDGESLELLETIELEAGQYLDSRRYGDYLYLMTRQWGTERNPDGVDSRYPRIRLYTIALGAGVAERVIDTRTFDSNGWLDAVLTAQPDGILLSLNRWHNAGTDWRYRWHSEVHVLVPGEDGIPQLAGVAPLGGVLRDKFKLRYKDGLLTTISQQADWRTGNFSRATLLENFRLGEGGFKRIGGLELAPGETLFATRFHGDNIYIVTFLFVDPLFSIDNSNPVRPRVAGELEVPGWSNYIEWVDDQLFAVGIEDNRLTVSIFDVADPDNMSLKDRVFLNEDSWAYSEAQYDDQAISFFPEARLLMLPFTTWSWKSQEQIQAMQLISWDDAGLTLRGAIQHLDVPRRGTLRDQTVITISGREVVTTDIADPDLPLEGGKATLAWSASQLVRHGDYLLQLETAGDSYGGWYWRGPWMPDAESDPVLYVTSLDEPNMPVAELPLLPGRLLGASMQGVGPAAAAGSARLVLLQDLSERDPENPWVTPEAQHIVARLYSLADPLEPVLLNQDELKAPQYLSGAFTPHAVDDAIVWASAGGAGHYYAYAYGMIDVWWGPWYYPNPLAYLVTRYNAVTDTLSIPAWRGFSSNAAWSDSSPWIWQPPLLVTTTTTYTEHERPGTYPYYLARTRLIASDFSIPHEPLELPRAELPARLAAMRTLPDGLNHHLYFEPGHNLIEVWGWDRALAFPLFRQQFDDPGPGQRYAWSLAWVPPFHTRSLYAYTEGVSEYAMEVWFHPLNQNRFEKIRRFDFGNEWLGQNVTRDNLHFQATSQEIHLFKTDADAGTFDRAAVLQPDLPNLYELQLDQMLLTENTAYFPTRLYGVELVPLPNPPADAAPRAFRRLEAAAPWFELDASRWQRVALDETGGAGSLLAYRWLFRPDSLRELDPLATDRGDMRRQSAWFGGYAHHVRATSWIRHGDHDWIHAYIGADPESDGFYWWEPELGLVWTRADLYPWIHLCEGAEWLFFQPGSGSSGKRLFHSPGTGWFSMK